MSTYHSYHNTISDSHGRSHEPSTIPLNQTDFRTGTLDYPSFIHPVKLFTAEKTLIARSVGSVTETKRKEVAAKLVQRKRLFNPTC